MSDLPYLYQKVLDLVAKLPGNGITEVMVLAMPPDELLGHLNFLRRKLSEKNEGCEQ